MLATASLGKSFWAKAVNTACCVINRSPLTTVELKTPMEMWTGKPINYSELHIFGSHVYVMYNSQKTTKLDLKFKKCLFLGYADRVKGYRLWDPTAHKVVASRFVVFIEDKIQEKEECDSTTRETTSIQMEKEFQSNDSFEAAPQHEVNVTNESQAPATRTLNRERRRPGWHSDYVMESNIAHCLLTEDGEPSTLQEALNNPDASFWKKAMQEEIEPLHKNKMWELVPLPGEYLDVKTAFLHGNLKEEIYMLQQEGSKQKGKENLVCRLNKSMYSLKQASRCWYKRFDSFIRSLEYNRLHADPCAYFKRYGNDDFIILMLYVDDMLVAGPNKDRINKLKAQLAKEFEMKYLGPANKIPGMQIHRDRPISTSFPTNVKLSSKMSPSSEKERMKMSRVPYASAVRSLMFSIICTRPDIAYAVGVVSQYMAEPGREHWEAVKRILRYIKGDLDGSKSITGYVFTLSGGKVSWVSKLQSVVAMSTTEAEYVAAAQASKEAVWLKMLLEELRYKQEKITLFYDNQSALYLARNPAFQSKTKHIRVQYHFVHEKVEEGTVDMQKIHTDDNVADYLTKAINCDKFIWCRSSCGLAETSGYNGIRLLNDVTIRWNSSFLTWRSLRTKKV
uniref:Gag-Pol polyprotein n=1 Tax=Tanacetum cinerariifolium TaxID=118510 RepID=A0A699GK27_TANCI|nr:Gag-Pol polyprotein [Tanacetum cinerariifolium]